MKERILQLVVVCLSIILIGCKADKSPVPPKNTSQYHDVIIIGAGMSGLEAASVLQANNVDVMILEARNRVGGRLQTTTMDGAYIDLGASWLHDSQNNVLTGLAQSVGEPLIPTPVDPAETAIYDNGTLVGPADTAPIFEYYRPMEESLKSLTYVPCGSFEDAINCFIQNDIPPASVNIYTAYFYNVLNANWFGANTSGVSSYVGPSLLHQGTDELPATGYTNFINKIFNINSLNILLNSIVNKIDYTNDQVVVTTANNQTYYAKYVIITVPIGVLKTNAIQFAPNLPQDKQLAIQHMGFGSFTKVYLQFDSVFWDNSQIVSLPYTSNPDVNYYMFYNMAAFLNKPILLSMAVGNFSVTLENLTDNQIIDSIMTQIRLMYPAAPDPLSYVITRWDKDPFSNGAYTYPSTTTTVDDYTNLTTPVQNKLFFAGEAVGPVKIGSNDNKSGTADAAYLSGQNAANTILSAMR